MQYYILPIIKTAIFICCLASQVVQRFPVISQNWSETLLFHRQIHHPFSGKYWSDLLVAQVDASRPIGLIVHYHIPFPFISWLLICEDRFHHEFFRNFLTKNWSDLLYIAQADVSQGQAFCQKSTGLDYPCGYLSITVCIIHYCQAEVGNGLIYFKFGTQMFLIGLDN